VQRPSILKGKNWRQNVAAQAAGLTNCAAGVATAPSVIGETTTGENSMLVSENPAACALIERACVRHGSSRRDQLSRIVLTPQSLTGVLPWMKGFGRTFSLPTTIELFPREHRAVFNDYPGPKDRGLYDNGRVSVGAEPPSEHRASFHGVSKWRRWKPLDALYFFGYALTHYHAVPWSLKDAQLLAMKQSRRDGASVALKVRFLPSVHTHSAVQTFFFDESDLIVRHDYVADIIGSWARGAHLWLDYVTIEGIPIATRRRVLGRIGTYRSPVVALQARLATPKLVFD
jgi:hypothetical protein